MAHGYAELSRKTEGRLIADPRLLIRMSLVRAHHEEPVVAVSERFAAASKGLLTGVASLLVIPGELEVEALTVHPDVPRPTSEAGERQLRRSRGAARLARLPDELVGRHGLEPWTR